MNMMTQVSKHKYTGFVRDVATVNLNDISTEDKADAVRQLRSRNLQVVRSINELKSF